MGVGGQYAEVVTLLQAAITISGTTIQVPDVRADDYPLTTPFQVDLIEGTNVETATVTSRAAGSGVFGLSRGSPSYAFSTRARVRLLGGPYRWPERPGELATLADIPAQARTQQVEFVFDDGAVEEMVELLAEHGDKDALELFWRHLNVRRG